MLQQIIKDMYIDPEILAELSDEQREILFCKMREEQVRRWKISEAEHEKKMKKAKKKKKKDGKSVGWLLGADNNEWVWVMGDHPSDFKIEDVLERERLEKANQIARKEAEAARLKEEEELRRKEEEERILREEQLRLAREQEEIERKAREEEERIKQEEAAERELKERLAQEQAEEEKRRKAAEEAEQRLQEMKVKWQKAAAEERERLAREEEARRKEEERLKQEEKKRLELAVRQKEEQEARRASMEAAKRKRDQLEREKQEKDRQARELAEKAKKIRLQTEKERKALEEREKQSKTELKHRVEQLYDGLKKTDEDKNNMAEKDRDKIEDIWKVQLRRSKRADTERSQRARWAREEIRRSRLSGNFENLTLDEIYKQGLAPEEKPIIRPASGMPRPSQPVNRNDVVTWYKDDQYRKQAGISVDINGSRPAKWFHGVIPRERANELLQDKKPGSFLVRVSEKVWGYVLSYRAHDDKVKHFLIDASGETYQFFGADPSQQHSVHNRLGDLITYHKVIPISEHGKEILREPCGQEGPVPDYFDLFEDVGKGQSTSL
ncbi:SH2 domain-containing protein 4B-like [Patiria miniata]|uniref:SH2 domain-containing protein n=1 Tax=Patiria miniata TaxID=46514 RepID=A0A914A9K5_PATMI|nr:SH2 domain-containing protein 4B-like [Patiria miniata]XP_038060100.1 SH2 domain-containing protein 4B-like [Patiria miniata]